MTARLQAASPGSLTLLRTDRPLADFLVPLDARRNPLIGSTDVGDVSWVVPTVQARVATVAIGTIQGLGWRSYTTALRAIVEIAREKSKG